MKKLVIGITAHVDAGKTTLSEGMLYTGGTIRKVGRVDNGDAFLDTDAMEKARGITIFSKQAVLAYNDMEITLLDTPGHVDFSAEMERTLQVLDYAILVISGADGVQGHTRTLWRLLERYQIPVFLFINKMDQAGTDKEQLMAEIKEQLSEGCIFFGEDDAESFFEEVAMEDEEAMEQLLETGTLELDDIQQLIVNRKVFPCFFGAALKLEGIEAFLQGIEKYAVMPAYNVDFGARVFKIARDEQGNRLTYLKVTGGSLKVKSVVDEQKINQIRIYSGSKFEAISEAVAGTVCAVTGLDNTRAGQGLGCEKEVTMPVLEPVLNYQIILPEGIDAALMLPKLRQIEEEEPELHIEWKEDLQEIHAKVMGEVQIEILKNLISERFGVEVAFGAGNIVYKETIANIVEGVGHFEPLRHYAEVHVILEPGETGSGMQFATSCSEDVLDKNWQRLIYTHFVEKEHVGVLTGSPITDMKITLVTGRAHLKHTEGGDFRQATYRAIRHGLKQAESVLLEPYYEFRLEVPQNMVGRAMTDIEKMHGTFEGPIQEGEQAVLTGYAPVACIGDYPMDVVAYTKGQGRIMLSFMGYKPCHNTDEVVERIAYDSERDLENPTGSVFCAHGAGFTVPWNEVKDYMHLESVLEEKEDSTENVMNQHRISSYVEEEWIDPEEVDAILARTYQANAHRKEDVKKWRSAKKVIAPTSTESAYMSYGAKARNATTKEAYLLVDGYNIIFAWEDFKELAESNIDGARGRLLDILCNYQGIKKCNLIVVFDAYRVQGHQTEIIDYHNIHVVYTKEAETADAYIEKFAHENGKKYDVTVATSDGLEQVIIRGQGCKLFSAREFAEEVKRASASVEESIQNMKEKTHNYLMDAASDEVKKEIENINKQ